MDPTITWQAWANAFLALDQAIDVLERPGVDLGTRDKQEAFLTSTQEAFGPWSDLYPREQLQAVLDDLLRFLEPDSPSVFDRRLLAMLNPVANAREIHRQTWYDRLRHTLRWSQAMTVLVRHNVSASSAFADRPDAIVTVAGRAEFDRFTNEMKQRLATPFSTFDESLRDHLSIGRIRPDDASAQWLAEGGEGSFAEKMLASNKMLQEPGLIFEVFFSVFQQSDLEILAKFSEIANDNPSHFRRLGINGDLNGKPLDGNTYNLEIQQALASALSNYYNKVANGSAISGVEALMKIATSTEQILLTTQSALSAMAQTQAFFQAYVAALGGPRYDSVYDQLLLAPSPFPSAPGPPAMPRLTTAKYWSPKIPPLLRKVMDPMMTQAEWRQAFDEFDQGIGWDLTDACEDLSTPVLQGRFLRRFYQAIGPLRDYYAPRDLQAMINDLMRAKREQTASWMDLLLLAFLNPSFDTSVLDDEDFTKQLVRRDDLQMHDVWTVVLRHSVVGPVLFAESPDNVISDTLEHERTRFDNEMALRFDVQHVLSYYRPDTREEIQIGRIRPEPGRQAQLAAVEKSVESFESTESFEFIETFESLDRVMGDPRMVDKAFISAFEHSDIPLLAMFADVLKNDVQKLYALKLVDHEVGSLLPMDGNSKNNAHQQILAINLLDYFAQIERQHLAGAMQSLSNIALAIEDITFVTTEKSWLAIVVERLRFVNAYIALTGSAPYESLYDRVL